MCSNWSVRSLRASWCLFLMLDSVASNCTVDNSKSLRTLLISASRFLLTSLCMVKKNGIAINIYWSFWDVNFIKKKKDSATFDVLTWYNWFNKVVQRTNKQSHMSLCKIYTCVFAWVSGCCITPDEQFSAWLMFLIGWHTTLSFIFHNTCN